MKSQKDPSLSVIVIFHNMQREAKRTLYGLSPGHQKDVTAEDYEVIAIDNGSSRPLDGSWMTGLAPNIRYHYHATTSVSPVEAVNLGVSMATADNVAVIVDGARMPSPGLVATSLSALQLAADPAVCSLSWHLGPDVQNRSMLQGYDQGQEDQLLQTIAWPEDGYRLFEISVLSAASDPGFFSGIPSELSWIAVRRRTFLELGGFDEQFQSAGGGLVNQHFRNRLMSRSGVTPIMLLGEGVFHQYHGGVATNVPKERHPMNDFIDEYQAITGSDYKVLPTPEVVHFGRLPEVARRFVCPR